MIIGVVGFIGSGKGTVSDILVEKYGYQKFAFADVLKDTVSVMFGWPRHLLEGDTNESRKFRETIDDFWDDRLSDKLGKSITPRYILQIIGTEAGRDVFGEDIWVSTLERRIRGIENVVISDVRFPNEIKFVQDRDGMVTRVVRGRDPEWFDTALDHNRGIKYDMHSRYPEVHVSEWVWIGQPFDYVLSNNGTKVELEACVKHMLDIYTRPVKLQKSA
jgi:hypothetical protein